MIADVSDLCLEVVAAATSLTSSFFISHQIYSIINLENHNHNRSRKTRKTRLYKPIIDVIIQSCMMYSIGQLSSALSIILGFVMVADRGVTINVYINSFSAEAHITAVSSVFTVNYYILPSDISQNSISCRENLSRTFPRRCWLQDWCIRRRESPIPMVHPAMTDNYPTQLALTQTARHKQDLNREKLAIHSA